MITDLDKQTALVLIDLQKGILKFDAEPYPLKIVIENSALLVEAFRKAHLPIVIVNVKPLGAAWTKARVDAPSVPKGNLKQTVAKAVLPLTDFADIIPEIKTQPTDIFVTKHTWGAFFETKLHEELQQRNVTGIVLGGVSTSIGVEGTARQASEFGYNISFPQDATTDRNISDYEHSVKSIFPRIGEIGTTKDILNKLQKLAG